MRHYVPVSQAQFCAACGTALAGARYCGQCGADSVAGGLAGISGYDVDAVIDWLLAGLSGVPGIVDYQRTPQGRLQIRSERVQWWAVVVAILCFPIGLLALMAKERLVCEVRVFVDDAGRPQLAVSGSASGAVRSRLKKLGRAFYRHYADERQAAPLPA